MSGLDTIFAIVMVGHSLFGADGPDMLQQALHAGTGDDAVHAQPLDGAAFRRNRAHSHQAEGVDARAILPDGQTTHLILTETIALAHHLGQSETEVFAQAFAGLVAAANPQAHVYVQETWHSLSSGTGVSVAHDAGADVPWRQRLTEDLPVWEGVVAQIAAGTRLDKAQVGLIPAGQAMAWLYDETAAGRIGGFEDISALFADDIHLNHTGHYFVAMVQYATLTGSCPLGLPVDFNNRYRQPFETPDPDIARDLQRVAWATVTAYGWPIRMPRTLSSIGRLILTDMPQGATSLRGRYVLRFRGKGVIEVSGRGTNVRYGKGEVSFDYSPGPGSVEIRIQRINTTNPPRDITVTHRDTDGALHGGAVFDPARLERFGRFRALGFTDWLGPNSVRFSAWAGRPLPGDVPYHSGVPVEAIMALANKLLPDPWVNRPHLGDDNPRWDALVGCK